VAHLQPALYASALDNLAMSRGGTRTDLIVEAIHLLMEKEGRRLDAEYTEEDDAA
jgi:hypothetical protein